MSRQTSGPRGCAFCCMKVLESVWRSASAERRLVLPQVQFLEKIVALVVDDDEGGKVDHLYAPDRLHAELRIFDALDLLDAVLGEVCRRAADRGEIEAAVLPAGFAHRGGAIAFRQHHQR